MAQLITEYYYIRHAEKKKRTVFRVLTCTELKPPKGVAYNSKTAIEKVNECHSRGAHSFVLLQSYKGTYRYHILDSIIATERVV